jgi:hypothetical protein
LVHQAVASAVELIDAELRTLRDARLHSTRRAEQTMGMPAHARRWTAAEVRELTDEQRHWPRYELTDGELLVTPAPRPVHQLAVGAMFRAIADCVDAQRLGVTLTSPIGLGARARSLA